jgi:AraC-like DNA-binding protein
VDNIEDHFIIFGDFRDIIFQNGKVNDYVCNFPYKLKGAVMAVLCTDGKIKAKIGVKNVEMKKQDMLVILPEQIFEITEVTPDYNVLVAVMKDVFFDIRNNLSELKELQLFIMQEQKFFIPEQSMNEFLSLFELMKTKLAKPNEFTSQIIQHYCYILFYNCFAFYRQKQIGYQTTVVNKNQKETVFKRFINEVEHNFKTHHTIDFYANTLCITPKYLSLLIKEASGKTAADWIREYLILESRALLKSGRMTVKQVANELNFADQSHFGSFFKRYTGYSPREYQQQ